MSLSKYELYKQLEERLLAELELVRANLAEYQPHQSHNGGTTAVVQSKEKHRPAPKGEGIPKGGMNWEQYVVEILKALPGKRGKTRDVVAYAHKANPKLDPETVLDAVRGKLSKLYGKKVIGANTTEAKSEGYEFFINQ